MPEQLTAQELKTLMERVFRPGAEDRSLAFLVDLPDAQTADNPLWSDRRQMVSQWVSEMSSLGDGLGLEIALYCYRNVGSNNAELPVGAWRSQDGRIPSSAEGLDRGDLVDFETVFDSHALLVAPTEFSATAPLKKAAAAKGTFRAATMPGFTAAMIPALRLDFVEIDRRVRIIQALLDQAVEALIEFEVAGLGNRRLRLDLRHRQAHASGGLIIEPGTAGNIPSGEAYIVPYEGEIEGYPSRSEGLLPVQFDDEVVLYRIRGNRALSVESSGPVSSREGEAVRREPAYGNLAELGLGVLSDFGIAPMGVILMDEKLGLHIAFGRSDHFGGCVGPEDFSTPRAVVHIDRIFLPQLMPKVRVVRMELHDNRNHVATLIRNDRYTFDFSWHPHF